MQFNNFKPEDFKFSTKFMVQFDETDKAGIVHNSNYIKFFERGRTAYIHNLGFKWQVEDVGDDYYVVINENYCRYLAPATFEDILEIHLRISQIKKTSYRFEYLITRGDKSIAEGFTTLAKIDPESFRPKRLSERFANKARGFEGLSLE